jgi:hypothetical protein
MGGQIFISYRIDDSQASAGRIYDRLHSHFASNRIFMDVANLAPGVDFVDAIEKSVSSCDALIAVIGRDWLVSSDEKGGRRLDNPQDFVRVEIATALKRGVIVIPVLVEDASMPKAGDLPEDLKPLSRRNAFEIRHTRFNDDCARLIVALEQALRLARKEQPSGQDAVSEIVAPDSATSDLRDTANTIGAREGHFKGGSAAENRLPLSLPQVLMKVGKSRWRKAALVGLTIFAAITLAVYLIDQVKQDSAPAVGRQSHVEEKKLTPAPTEPATPTLETRTRLASEVTESVVKFLSAVQSAQQGAIKQDEYDRAYNEFEVRRAILGTQLLSYLRDPQIAADWKTLSDAVIEVYALSDTWREPYLSQRIDKLKSSFSLDASDWELLQRVELKKGSWEDFQRYYKAWWNLREAVLSRTADFTGRILDARPD